MPKKQQRVDIQEEISFLDKSPEIRLKLAHDLEEYRRKVEPYIMHNWRMDPTPSGAILRFTARSPKCAYVAQKKLDKLLVTAGLKEKTPRKPYVRRRIGYDDVIVKILKVHKPKPGKPPYPRITTTVPAKWIEGFEGVKVTIERVKEDIKAVRVGERKLREMDQYQRGKMEENLTEEDKEWAPYEAAAKKYDEELKKRSQLAREIYKN